MKMILMKQLLVVVESVVLNKLLEHPSTKALLFFIATIITFLVGAIPVAHGYIVKDIEDGVELKLEKVEDKLERLITQGDFNHRLLLQEFSSERQHREKETVRLSERLEKIEKKLGL